MRCHLDIVRENERLWARVAELEAAMPAGSSLRSGRIPYTHRSRRARIEDVLPLWRSGLTQREMGEKLGVTGEMIRLRLKEYGLPLHGPRNRLRLERLVREDVARAERRANLKRGQNGYWSRERIIAAIQAFNEKYGRPPTAQDLNAGMARANRRPDLVERFYADGCWPHTGTVMYVFKSFNAAIAAAGFEPRKPGKRGPTSDYAREHLLPVTRAKRIARPRTHCKRGHELTPDNIITTRAQRLCRACHRARCHETYLRRKARLAHEGGKETAWT